MFESSLIAEAELVLNAFAGAKAKLTLAESCTGGLAAAAVTAWAGSSEIFERGFVTYSNSAKTEMLGVSAALIAEKGAVSAEVASAMAGGALASARADIAVSITGIAGPSGGSADKPVGLVFIGGTSRTGIMKVERHLFTGTRAEIRIDAAIAALRLAVLLLRGEGRTALV